jgi:hypothetical protein
MYYALSSACMAEVFTWRRFMAGGANKASAFIGHMF